MNRRLSKSKYLLVSASILLMLAIVFCSIIGNFTRQGDKTVTAVSAESGTASVLNLNGQGISKNNFSDILQGGQNEYIYFGENPYSTIKNMPGYATGFAATGVCQRRNGEEPY